MNYAIRSSLLLLILDNIVWNDRVSVSSEVQKYRNTFTTIYNIQKKINKAKNYYKSSLSND